MSKNNLQISDNEKRELKKKLLLAPGFIVQGKLGEFFDLFLVCEVTARKLIQYYNKRVTLKPSDKYSVTKIETSYKYFTGQLTCPLYIREIFESKKRSRNMKTCRQLRNTYLHSLSNDEKTEIENRLSEFKGNMNEWISFINELIINKH